MINASILESNDFFIAKLPEPTTIETFDIFLLSFSENFNLHRFRESIGDDYSFVQDNKSVSKKGVFRGCGSLQKTYYRV